jgi:pSer/pThr/pTyr-binding forkhead associated (FHA) protein
MKVFKAIVIDVFENERLLNRFSLNTETISIGRHPHCDIVLDNSCVSRRHAIISYKKGHWTITNHGKNGILFEGEEIVQHDVMQNNKFQLGPYTLLVKKIVVDNSFSTGDSGTQKTIIAKIFDT